MALFRVASASEYLAITGWGVDDVKLVKKAWVFPGQRCKKFSIAPVNYEFNVNAMSAEKLPFALPAVFTIGPRADDPAALLTYAKLVASSRRRHCFADFVPLVRGIVEGEARVLAASMTMEEIFQGSKAFKQAVFDKVQLELNQFGLFIYNANVKQLVDVPGQKYFSYLGQKKQHEAANQAKADVAAAKLKGDVGEKNMEGLTKQNEARVEAETKMEAARQQGRVKKEEERARAEVRLFETERKAETEKAESELRKVMAGWERQARVAEVEATKAVAMREAELQAEVEKRNAARQTEKLEAEHLTKAIIDSEVKVQQANADLHRRQTAAAALLFEKEKEAEARKAAAEAELFARQKEADAQLYAKQKEAKGLAAMGKAHGAYISSVLEAVGGDYGALRDYLMVSSGVYQDMARINADAVRGLEPNITVWSNGAAAGGGMKEVAGVYSMLPSVLPMLHEQTGMATPARVGSSAASTQSDAN